MAFKFDLEMETLEQKLKDLEDYKRERALTNCVKGEHDWKRDTTSYGDQMSGTRTCKRCGQVEKIWGYKIYEPPYYTTGSKVIKKGKY